MEIIPNSTVILCHNVPLESNYENTIFWKKTQVDDGTQETYFKKFEVMRFNNQYYQRKDKGSLKLEVAMEKIFDCNYMMFRNSSFEKKWFYAFVDRIEYINNVTCAIYYTIDIMQTYIGDYELNNCFVEREHSSTDNVGDNLIPEQLDTGEKISIDVTTDEHLTLDKYRVVVVRSSTGGTSVDVRGSMFGNVYQDVGYTTFNIAQESDLDALNQAIKVTAENNMISIFMFPLDYLPADSVMPVETIEEHGKIVGNKYYEKTINIPATLNGYIPKNKKLFTSPYLSLEVSNLQGDTQEYGFEYFLNNNLHNAKFKSYATFSANPSIILIPMNYQNLAEDKNSSIEIGNFPQCAWTSSGYKQWVYNGGILNGLKGVGNALAQQQIGNKYRGRTPKHNAWTSGGKKQIAEEKLSIVNSVADTLMQGIVASRTGNRTHDFGGSTSMLSANMQNFWFNTRCVREEYARNIDGYFTMYGYATNQIKNPNRNVRTNCTYLKTIGCTINGSVPAEDERAICDIHDNGIRYWNGTNVSNGTVQVAKYLDGNEYITNAVLPQ